MTTDGRVIGVPDVEETVPVDDVVAAISEAGGSSVVASPESIAGRDCHAIVTVGEPCFRAVARHAPAAPLLPVDVDAGVRSVHSADLATAVARTLDGATDRDHHPILSVQVDGEQSARVVREATLLTAEPARISEFAVESAIAGHVDQVRADGIVVATPAGSHGYAAAGNGPLLAPGTGLAVVPIAPFRIDRTCWVVPSKPVTLEVRRDEATVAVEVDGHEIDDVGNDATLRFAPDDTFVTLAVEESCPTFP